MLLATTTMTSVKKAYKEIKHFSPDSWEGDYRDSARQALKAILGQRMQADGFIWNRHGPRKCQVAERASTRDIF